MIENRMTPTPDSQWRLDLAKKMAVAYAENPKTCVVMVAGSTGRGTADAYSDIEIDVYYDEAPTEEERVAAVGRCGAELLGIAHDEVEWEERMSFGGFPAATSTFLVSTMERFLEQVVDRCDSDLEAQMRLYSVLNAVPVVGEDVSDRWRDKASSYPDGLVDVVLDENLHFVRLFRHANVMIARNDTLALTDGILDVQKRILRALLGLNRIYLSIPDPIKRLDEIVGQLRLKPENLGERLRLILRAEGREAIDSLWELVDDVFDLVAEQGVDFDVEERRNNHLIRVRESWDGPPALGDAE